MCRVQAAHVIEPRYSPDTRRAHCAEARTGKCLCRGHLTRRSAARTLLPVARSWRECLQERLVGQAGAAAFATPPCTGRRGNSLGGSSNCRSSDAHRTRSHGKRSRSRCLSQSGSACAGSSNRTSFARPGGPSPSSPHPGPAACLGIKGGDSSCRAARKAVEPPRHSSPADLLPSCSLGDRKAGTPPRRCPRRGFNSYSSCSPFPRARPRAKSAACPPAWPLPAQIPTGLSSGSTAEQSHDSPGDHT